MPERSIDAKPIGQECDWDTALDELVSLCREAWTTSQARDLNARHEMGTLLNARLGNPGTPQKYGAGTAKEVANRIGISISELSRVRKFAYRYPDIADFRSRQPNCLNWTKVKELLVDKKADPSRSKADDQKSVSRLANRLREVAATLEGASPKYATNVEIRNALKKLVVAARPYLEADA